MQFMDFIDTCKWVVGIEEDGTWRCEHVDANGSPLPPTRLNVKDAADEWAAASLERKRCRIACADCGTWWRVWPYGRKAQYYAAALWGTLPVFARHPEYRQPDRKHICRVIELVQQALPKCEVTQLAAYVPSQNDDGIWWFKLPSAKKDIQTESGSGMCPFIGETDEWSSYDARTYETVEQTVEAIVEWLEEQESHAEED
jgi:hypothetical protein